MPPSHYEAIPREITMLSKSILQNSCYIEGYLRRFLLISMPFRPISSYKPLSPGQEPLFSIQIKLKFLGKYRVFLTAPSRFSLVSMSFRPVLGSKPLFSGQNTLFSIQIKLKFLGKYRVFLTIPSRFSLISVSFRSILGSKPLFWVKMPCFLYKLN